MWRISERHYVLAKVFLFLLILPTSMYCISAANVSAEITVRIPLIYSHYGVLSQNYGAAVIKQQEQGLTEVLMGDKVRKLDTRSQRLQAQITNLNFGGGVFIGRQQHLPRAASVQEPGVQENS